MWDEVCCNSSMFLSRLGKKFLPLLIQNAKVFKVLNSFAFFLGSNGLWILALLGAWMFCFVR